MNYEIKLFRIFIFRRSPKLKSSKLSQNQAKILQIWWKIHEFFFVYKIRYKEQCLLVKDLQILPFKKVFKVKFKFEHTIDVCGNGKLRFSVT